MAIINILAKSENSIVWKDLLHQYSKLNLSHIEIFPIPIDLGFEQDSLGINVQSNYSDKKIVLSELKQVIDFFDKYNLKFVELYNGEGITRDNIGDITNRLLI